jgi:phosphoglycerol transferase MdoB-like AlkP superfamily enzyme
MTTRLPRVPAVLRRPQSTLTGLARPAGIHLVFGLVVSILAVTVIEAARTGLDWSYLGFLVSRHAGVIVVGVAVVLLVVAALLAVTGRMWVTASVVLCVATVVGLASQLKYEVRREPLYPRDLVFMLEPKFLLEMVEPRLLWLALLGLVPLVAFAWGLSRLFTLWLRRGPSPEHTARRRTLLVARFAVAALCVTLLSSLIQFNHTGNVWRTAYEAAGAHWAKASQPNNYRNNGFLGGFLYNLDIPAMTIPPGYSRAAMQRIVARYSSLAEHHNEGRDPDALEDVNVISILAESFSDPARLAGIRLAEDPIPHTRELMAEIPSGLMLSQKIGGGTSAMEFETLTGMALAHFNSAMDTPYQMLIPSRRTFPSAVEMFNQLGHSTLAIHPYRSTMYQRDHVYPILGFSDFVDGSRMEHRGRRGENPYIADLDAYFQVLDAIESHDEPVFVNLVTMQNHAPYTGNYSDPIAVAGLTGEDAEMVGQYARGLTYSDRAIRHLIRKIGRSEEKTVVLLYGDHLPAVPETLFEQNSHRTLHETPFFIYTNFTKMRPEQLPTTSPVFFLPRVLDMVGAPLPPYYVLLRELEQHVSALSHDRMIGSGNYEVTPSTLDPDAAALLRDYRLVQYDLAVGHRYAEEMMYPAPMGTVAASDAAE